jgi:Uma2 family endonuclease
MAEVLDEIEGPPPLVVRTAPVFEMNDDDLFRFCQINHQLRIERTSKGDLIFMPPAGGSSGRGNAKLTYFFSAWAEPEGSGQIFDSSAGFKLPNRAMRAPDVAWVRNERLEKLSNEDWERFLPLCPDFVLELRSPSDSLTSLQEKMEEYVENGAQLGWLLDPKSKTVYIYKPGEPVQIIKNPGQLSGDLVLPGFVLDLPEVWAAMERKKLQWPN